MATANNFTPAFVQLMIDNASRLAREAAAAAPQLAPPHQAPPQQAVAQAAARNTRGVKRDLGLRHGLTCSSARKLFDLHLRRVPAPHAALAERLRAANTGNTRATPRNADSPNANLTLARCYLERVESFAVGGAQLACSQPQRWCKPADAAEDRTVIVTSALMFKAWQHKHHTATAIPTVPTLISATPDLTPYNLQGRATAHAIAVKSRKTIFQTSLVSPMKVRSDASAKAALLAYAVNMLQYTVPRIVERIAARIADADDDTDNTLTLDQDVAAIASAFSDYDVACVQDFVDPPD